MLKYPYLLRSLHMQVPVLLVMRIEALLMMVLETLAILSKIAFFLPIISQLELYVLSATTFLIDLQFFLIIRLITIVNLQQASPDSFFLILRTFLGEVYHRIPR